MRLLIRKRKRVEEKPEFDSPIRTIIDNVRHPHAMKLAWEMLSDSGRHNLSLILKGYPENVQKRWEKAIAAPSTESFF